MIRLLPGLLSKSFHVNKKSCVVLSKTFSSMQSEVVHDAGNKMFYLKIGDEKAVLLYEKKNNALDLYETKVPPVLRGRGIAQILAKAAFDHIVENDMKMKVTCTYLQSYLNKNPSPEYISRVIE